jgi:hypothetical protein
LNLTLALEACGDLRVAVDLKMLREGFKSKEYRWLINTSSQKA